MAQKISYYEVAKGDPEDPGDRGVDGPESEVFEVPVEGLSLGGTSFDPLGEWVGQIMLVHVKATLNFDGNGGRLQYGGESLRFDAKWDGGQKAYLLTLYAREGEREVPTGMTLYLRRLTRERLWLGAPPIVFHRPNAPRERQGGFFDWFFGERR
jgi:hypothetical protein